MTTPYVSKIKGSHLQVTCGSICEQDHEDDLSAIAVPSPAASDIPSPVTTAVPSPAGSRKCRNSPAVTSPAKGEVR